MQRCGYSRWQSSQKPGPDIFPTHYYAVDFPKPDAALRERLWRGMFPSAAPLGDDVDFHFLVEQFEISGGEIQEIALDAVFLASAGNQVIGMAEVVQTIACH